MALMIYCRSEHRPVPIYVISINFFFTKSTAFAVQFGSHSHTVRILVYVREQFCLMACSRRCRHEPHHSVSLFIHFAQNVRLMFLFSSFFRFCVLFFIHLFLSAVHIVCAEHNDTAPSTSAECCCFFLSVSFNSNADTRRALTHHSVPNAMKWQLNRQRREKLNIICIVGVVGGLEAHSMAVDYRRFIRFRKKEKNISILRSLLMPSNAYCVNNLFLKWTNTVSTTALAGSRTSHKHCCRLETKTTWRCNKRDQKCSRRVRAKGTDASRVMICSRSNKKEKRATSRGTWKGEREREKKNNGMLHSSDSTTINTPLVQCAKLTCFHFSFPI